ncbi:MAG: hypothetical protein M3235_06190, partial [Actinomycetota bacterium]|nr:hypothetical protein [Actinomycetota bacterium]
MSESTRTARPVPTGPIDEDLVARAEERVRRWAVRAAPGGGSGPSARLAALMHDPSGVDFTLQFVDRVARPADD